MLPKRTLCKPILPVAASAGAWQPRKSGAFAANLCFQPCKPIGEVTPFCKCSISGCRQRFSGLNDRVATSADLRWRDTAREGPCFCVHYVKASGTSCKKNCRIPNFRPNDGSRKCISVPACGGIKELTGASAGQTMVQKRPNDDSSHTRG
jgi:hypothetical protein